MDVVNCGCQNRKEIMSQGNWQVDAFIVLGLVAAVSLGLYFKGK